MALAGANIEQRGVERAFDLFAFDEGDFTLEGYDPHPHIKAPIAV